MFAGHLFAAVAWLDLDPLSVRRFAGSQSGPSAPPSAALKTPQ
jgi:hypothetical protein